MIKKYDVIGIGSALLDFIVEVDETILKEMGLNKGQMHLIDENKSKEILKKMGNHNVKIAAGGSSANALAGVSALGGTAAFLGKIGNDMHGDIYEQKTAEDGVKTILSRHNTPTGHAITFITPDAERTFATHLGASLYFRKDNILEEEIKSSKMLHVEGYQLEDPELKAASMRAMDIAKANNVKISIDLSDHALIKRNLEPLKQLVREYADIVFVNEKEAEAFTGKKEEEALHEISKICKIAIVKLGERGSLIKSNNIVYRIPAYKVNVVNTNGAGDAYAAGILYSIAKGLPIEKAGRIGSYAASLAVSQIGARLNKRLNVECIK